MKEEMEFAIRQWAFGGKIISGMLQGDTNYHIYTRHGPTGRNANKPSRNNMIKIPLILAFLL